MNKLPVLSAEALLKMLFKEGFVFVNQKGSHMKLKRLLNGKIISVTVPNHKTLKIGTLRSILRQAGVDFEKFMKR